MTLSERYKSVLEYFISSNAPDQPELVYKDPFSLLVAVVLSAQCTDKRVNIVTPALLEAYPTPQKMASASPEEILPYIRSVSYPNAKSKHLYEMSVMLNDEYNGTVPDTLENLIRLPGVGRKTANVILAVCFGRPAMAVDTHVFRVANRIGLTDNSRTPLATEQTLTRHIPPELIPRAHHWLILHGRYVCTARAPHCQECGLAACCKYFATNTKAKQTDM